MPRDQNSYSGAEFEEDEPAEHEPAEHDSGTVGDPAAVMEAPTEGRAQGWALGGNQDHQAEHRTDEALEQDLERTGHILRYVESVCGGETARQLEGLVGDSRGLADMRQMRGDPTSYSDDTHEQYLQCILDLPATLDAKQAMAPERWGDDDLEEAARHEVNRMGYRLNLEIRDRLMNQFDHPRGIAKYARDRGVDGELLEMVGLAGEGKQHWIKGQKASEEPVHSRVEATAYFYIVEIGLVNALEEGDHAAVQDFVAPVRGTDDLRGRAERAMAYVPPEEQELVREALEIASRWTDDQIRDGAMDHHARYADLEYQYSNGARERWLEDTGQAGDRPERAGDCVARALNEATGGQDYGSVWDDITRGTQVAFPEKDADLGVSNLHFRDAYEQHGMKMVMARSEELNHIMRKHLDMREIPSLMEGIIPEGEPITYIACSDGHAVAVVDSAVHDAWDSRDMGDPGRYLKDGKLVELWVKTDDQDVADAITERLRKYEEIRRYDDVLTYRRRRRETIPPPAEMEE